MYILGINAYHGDASAVIIKDGKLVAAAEEERFNRLKHSAGFPYLALKYCLEEAGIKPKEIDHIAISRDPKAHLHKKILFTFTKVPSFNLVKGRLLNLIKVRNPQKEVAKALGVAPHTIRAKLWNVEHHKAHLASTFFVSPFNEAAIFSIDAFGDFVSTMWGMGKDNKIEIHDWIEFPHSLGIFYTALTQYLGFLKFGDEYKVMGLASYGEPCYLDRLREIVKLKNNGCFELNLDYFIHTKEGVDMTWDKGTPHLGKIYSRKLINLLGPERGPKGQIEKRHQDIASSLQAMLEEAEFLLLNKLYEKTKSRNLCLAGGVALNCTANGKIFKKTPFENIFIQPVSSDAGTSLGAAYWVWHQILGRARSYVMNDVYTGPSYTNEEIKRILDEYNVGYDFLEFPGLTRQAAKYIAQGRVIGWYQGRVEFGPRALGNRSIIADPRRRNMKDILNLRIKYREPFRPFAPSVLEEKASEYFDINHPSPYMLITRPVKIDKRKIIPAVTHVDGTARMQTVNKKTNPLYWQLIKEFENLTGVPVVLNTSFNENEPIVNSPREAIECFLRTKMDVLVLGNYLAKK